MRLTATAQSFHVNREVGYPDQRDSDVQRPFEFRVFATLGEAHHVGQRAQRHAAGPTPEGELGQPRKGQTCLRRALDYVIGGGKQRAAAKTEDYQCGVNRTQPAERQGGNIEIEEGPGQFAGDENADAHAEHRKHHGHDGELADDVVIILLDRQC